MFFGMLAVALQAASLFVAMMFLRRERAHGWTYGHPIVFEVQNLLSTACPVSQQTAAAEGQPRN